MSDPTQLPVMTDRNSLSAVLANAAPVSSIEGAYPLFTMFDLISGSSTGPFEERMRYRRPRGPGSRHRR